MEQNTEKAKSNMSPERIEKMRQARLAKNSVPLDPIEKAIQNPRSRRYAINAKCYDCCCNQKNEVKYCPINDCPLWNFRPWQPKENKSTIGFACPDNGCEPIQAE
jgi:hypothetical protein